MASSPTLRRLIGYMLQANNLFFDNSGYSLAQTLFTIENLYLTYSSLSVMWFLYICSSHPWIKPSIRADHVVFTT